MSNIPEFVAVEYSVYARANENNKVIYIFSTCFEQPLENDVLIKTGYGDEYIHVGYYNLVTEDYAHRYKIADGVFTECTSEEIAIEVAQIYNKETYIAELNELQSISGGKLTEEGWYRIAKYPGGEGSMFANSCEISIKRAFENTENEYHNLRLVSVASLYEFQPITSKSNIQLVDKIRYTYDDNNGYIEIYYRGNTVEPVHISITKAKDYNYKWTATIPELTEETVNGVNVVCQFDIVSEVSTLTNLDLEKIIDGEISIGDAAKLGGVEASKYAQKTFVAEQIASSNHLKHTIVTTIPTKENAVENVIYMYPVEGATGDIYQEYQLIDGEIRMIGDTSVDLSGYVKIGDIESGKIAIKTEKATIDSEGNNIAETFAGIKDGTIKVGDAGKLNGYSVAEVGHNGARNLIPYPYSETTKKLYGIDFIDNGDGTITVNGTATGQAVFNCCMVTGSNSWYVPNGIYTLSGCPSNGSGSTYRIQFAYENENGNLTSYMWDTGNGKTAEISNSSKKMYVQIVIEQNTTVKNLIFKPMLELGKIAHSYIPYHFGGAEDATKLNGLLIKEFVSNENLLKNGDLLLNTTGSEIYNTFNKEAVNGWIFGSGGSGNTGEYNAITKTLTCGTKNTSGYYTYLAQYIDNPARYAGKTLTVSMNCKEAVGENYIQIWRYTASTGKTTSVEATSSGMSEGTYKERTFTMPTDLAEGDTIRMVFQTRDYLVFDYVKLEHGAVATPFIPPNKEVEKLKLDISPMNKKTSGSYSGNSKSAKRIIATGGIGNAVILWSTYSVGFVFGSCGIFFNATSGDATVLNNIKFISASGELEINNASTHCNSSSYTYGYVVI